MPCARATSGGRSLVESVTTRDQLLRLLDGDDPHLAQADQVAQDLAVRRAGRASSRRPTVTQAGSTASSSCWRGLKRASKKAGPSCTRARARGSGASWTRSSRARKTSDLTSCSISRSTPAGRRSQSQNGPASSVAQAQERLDPPRLPRRRRDHLAAVEGHLAARADDPPRDLRPARRPHQLEEGEQREIAHQRFEVRVRLDADLPAEQDQMDAPHQVLRRQAVRQQEEHVLGQLPPLLRRAAEQQQRVLGLPAPAPKRSATAPSPSFASATGTTTTPGPSVAA